MLTFLFLLITSELSLETIIMPNTMFNIAEHDIYNYSKFNMWSIFDLKGKILENILSLKFDLHLLGNEHLRYAYKCIIMKYSDFHGVDEGVLSWTNSDE